MPGEFLQWSWRCGLEHTAVELKQLAPASALLRDVRERDVRERDGGSAMVEGSTPSTRADRGIGCEHLAYGRAEDEGGVRDDERAGYGRQTMRGEMAGNDGAGN